ncbi:MAG: aldehyde dehydrogenase family protein, partial [Steroidobacteraceae bacterium]
MIEVTNPYTGEVDFRFEAVSANDLGACCAALRTAQPAWQASGLPARIEALMALSASLERHREAIVDALAVDTGRRLLA